MVNNCCWKGYVSTFCKIDKGSWLAEMVKNYRKVSFAGEKTPTKSMIASWDNCYDVLRETFAALPENYKNLFLLFEYALPLEKPVDGAYDPQRNVIADAILLSKNDIAILEFKGRKDSYDGVFKQVRKYRRRIQKWHTASIGMGKHAIAVCTEGHGICKRDYRAQAVSPDTLPAALGDAFGAQPVKMQSADTSAWKNSAYALRPQKAAA